jgi:hypothetical protein
MNDSVDDDGRVAPVQVIPIVTPESNTAALGVKERVGDNSFTAKVLGKATTANDDCATMFIVVPVVGVA